MKNNEEGSKKIIIKPTMGAVFNAQERLRKHIEQLEKDNRSLKDGQERELFFRELIYSTLGLGVNQNVYYNVPEEYAVNKESYMGIRCNVEVFGRWMGDQQSNIVNVPITLYYRGDNRIYSNVPIRNLWKLLKENLYCVFPEAIQKATSISKEETGKDKSSGYMIE